MQVFDLTRVEPYPLTVDQIDFMEANGNYTNDNEFSDYSEDDLLFYENCMDAIREQQQPFLEVVK